ncbi:hypothetical protein DASC09_015060 [Saccharomycopsis crataegensis]|uniref:non-specific serine/threonine protein kinase n=1 Tax=Saccharomycopsis crataegensis TaxID=43959 RepID=A0AAV5QHM0_9ASCO|nr:hypothetical protein DASC09_015060 [Saccharomycopsis crataegensis]
MTSMAAYQSQTSIASSLITSSHNTHQIHSHYHPNQNKKIGPWKFGPELGRGSTSKVILGTHESTGQQAAIKIVNKNHLDPQELSPNAIDAAGLPYGIQREIIILKLLDNKNILKLYDVYESKNHLYLITEYVSNGELFEYLVSVDPLPEPLAVRVFYELINGVFFLHNWGIIHRDLKLENILIDSDMHLKIADFGMATLELLKYSNTPSENSGRINSAHEMKNSKGPSTTSTTKKVPTFLLETTCGSPHYAAPEIISGVPYNGLKSDMWSCGVIFYALMTGRLPFDNDNIKDLLLKVKYGKFEMPSDLSIEAQDLISGLLCLDPEQRLDSEGVLKSNLFKKYNIGFYSTEKSQHDFYSNINLFTNSINQDLIKTNKQNHLIINDFNFNKRIQSNPKNISGRILNHLKILCHNRKAETDIISNLVNNKVNIDKVFYSLLIGFDNTSSTYLTKSPMEESFENEHFDMESDLEESYPAELHLNKSKMTKAYSNISIIASTSHRRNISFNNGKKKNSFHHHKQQSSSMNRNKSQRSLYNSGSIYRYSRNRISQSQMKSSRSFVSNSKAHMRSNKSISSYYNPNNNIPMAVRQSNSIASYNGSLNLSQYLQNDGPIDNWYPSRSQIMHSRKSNLYISQAQDFDDDFDDYYDEEEGIEFGDDDEAINVVSPGVPVFRFAEKKIKSSIDDLTGGYEKLKLNDKEEKLVEQSVSPPREKKMTIAKQEKPEPVTKAPPPLKQSQQKSQEVKNNGKSSKPAEKKQLQPPKLTYTRNSTSSNNFDFENSHEEVNRISLKEQEKQRKLEQEIEKSLNYSVNYKVSPKRNKRYKTSSLILNDENGYYHSVSPTKSKGSKSKKSKGSKASSKSDKRSKPKKHESVRSMKGSSSRRSMRSTLSSRVLSNYHYANTKMSRNSTRVYIDTLANQTKSEFESICDQFFGRTNENYQNMFGESYIERKTREQKEEKLRSQEEARLTKLRLEQEKKNQKAAAAASAAKANRSASVLTPDEIRQLVDKKNLDRHNIIISRGPISRLDPGLNVDNDRYFDKEAVAPVVTRNTRRGTATTGVTIRSATTPSSFQSSSDSLLFTPSNDIFEPTVLPNESAPATRNTSAGSKEVDVDKQNDGVVMYNGGQVPLRKMGLIKNKQISNGGMVNTRRQSRLQEVYNQETSYYDHETTEDLENDFEFVTPTSNKFDLKDDDDDDLHSRSNQIDDSLLLNTNIGDSTRDLVRRTLNCEMNYQDYYRDSVPELTDTSKSPFLQDSKVMSRHKTYNFDDDSTTATNPLTRKILNDEKTVFLKNSESMAMIAAAAAELSTKNVNNNDGKVRVFKDFNNSNDSSCNLITNGVPSSSRNMSAMLGKNIPTSLESPKPTRNNSLFRRLSLSGKKKPAASPETNMDNSDGLKTINETRNEPQPFIANHHRSSLASSNKAEPLTSNLGSETKRSSYIINSNKNNELMLTLSRTESIVAIKSLLVNWKKFGIRDVKVKDNVISGGIKNNNSKSFLKKTTAFKIFVYDNGNIKGKKRVVSGGGGSKLEFEKVKGSSVIFEKLLSEIEKALESENVLVAL